MSLPNRQSIRLRGYDYSQNGLYFCTICTHNREYLFGNIVGANHDSPLRMQLNQNGKNIESILKSLPKRYPILLDEFQIMPNHVHMVINIVGAIHESPLHRSLLSQIIGYLKMNSAKLIHNSVRANHDSPVRVWQRNYYEHIIRDETEYWKIKKYIQYNPQHWDNDENNVRAIHESPQQE